jgi:hypothetical protein
MVQKSNTTFAQLVVVLACSQLNALSFAALGEQPLVPERVSQTAQPSSVKALRSITAGTTSSYTVRSVELNSTTRVQEYLTSTGVVFALSWRGPVLPDLNVLLGSSFPSFNSEAQKARISGKRGGALAISANGLTVVSAGHMRDYYGYAYLEALVPPDVDIQSLLK